VKAVAAIRFAVENESAEHRATAATRERVKASNLLFQNLMSVAVVAVSSGTRHVFDGNDAAFQFRATLVFKLNG